jgi:hypothetical protein
MAAVLCGALAKAVGAARSQPAAACVVTRLVRLVVLSRFLLHSCVGIIWCLVQTADNTADMTQ